MKDSKTKEEESTRLAYTGLRHSCCHTYLDSRYSLPLVFFCLFVYNLQQNKKGRRPKGTKMSH
jgi:hypothetical protein